MSDTGVWVKQRLGPGIEVDDSRATRDRYSRTTLPEKTVPLAVVFPESTAQVQAVIQAAREKRIPIHPVSRGRNWGYGDALAPSDGFLIVDLSRMNRICDVNESLGFAVIEPGVSQGQLFEYLTTRNIPLWMDANGAGPDTSLVGNILERGFGHTPLGERASQYGDLEVVTGTGEILRTGFGHYKNARATHVYKHGIGPALDGLFLQSNYGIVTRMAINLAPKPEGFSGFFVSANEEEDLTGLVSRLSYLRRHGVVRSCMHLLNSLRVLMNRIEYPWEITHGRSPVPKEVRNSWRDKYGVGAWNVSGAVYGPRPLVEGAMAVVRKELSDYSLIELSDESIRHYRELGKTDLVETLEASRRFLSGTPTDAYLRTAGWRSRTLTAQETCPLKNGAGLMWIVPTLPATGEDALIVERILKEVLEEHGFDVPITFTFINERALTCTSNISFDRTSPEDCQHAATAYHLALKRLIAEGYPPYRSGIGGYEDLQDGSSFWEMCRGIKRLCDPDNIISPGHYVTEV